MKSIILTLFLLVCQLLSGYAQTIIKPDTNQKALLLNGLILKQQYKPVLKVSDINEFDYEDLCNKGTRFYDAGNYADAFICFKKANNYLIKLDSNKNYKTQNKFYNVGPLFYMALCQEGLDHPDSAKMILKEVMDKDPVHAEAHNEIGTIYIGELNADSAIFWFKGAIAINARHENALYNLAYVYLRKEDLAQAKKHLTALLNVNPKHERGTILLAYVYEWKGDEKKALHYYTETIANNANTHQGYLSRGLFFLRQKKYAEAGTDLTHYYGMDTADTEAMQLLADAQIRNGHVEQGMVLLTRILNKDTAGIDFKVDISGVEFYELMQILNSKKLKEDEQNACLRMFRLLYMDASANNQEIEQIRYEHQESLTCQRLYFLSLFLGNNHEKFKYQVYKLHGMSETLPNTHMMEALVSNASNTIPKRIESIRKAIKLDSTNSVYQYHLALQQMANGNEAEGHRILHQIIAKNKKFHQVYRALGTYYQQWKNFDSAIVLYQLGLTYSKDDAYYYYVIGECLAATNQKDSALSYFERVLKIKPEAYICYIRRAEVFMKSKDYAAAEIELNKFSEFEVKETEGYELKAEVLLKMKKIPQAFEIYNWLVSSNPDYLYFIVLRGDAYTEVKDYNMAMKDYKVAIAANPYYPYALRRVGATYFALGDSSEAISYYKRLIKLKNTGLTEDFMYVASVYTEMGYYQDAITYYEYALKANDKNVTAIGNIGWVHYCNGDFENCIKYSKRAIKLDSTAMFAGFNIALSELRLGNIKAAEKYYVDFLAQNARLRKGNPEGAITDLQDLINRNILVEESKSILKNIFKID